MADLLNIGRSGLAATRSALSVTGENIANVGTEGYRRRDTIQEEIGSAQASPFIQGSMSQGVMISEIRRAFDGLLAERTRMASSDLASAQAFLPHVSMLEERMQANGSGPVEMLESFFASLGGLSGDPAATGLRRVVLESGKALATSVADLGEGLGNLLSGVEAEAEIALGSANATLKDLAELQKAIGAQPREASRNPMLDKRDQMLTKLADIVDITVSYDDWGLAEVRLGSIPGGPLLLEGGENARLSMSNYDRVTVHPYDPSAKDMTRNLGSGQLHGLAMANATISDAISELDQWAVSIARDMNAVHAEGLDLNGEPGGRLFALEGWTAQATDAARGSATAVVTVTDVDLMPDGPLELVYDRPTGFWSLTTESGEALATGENRLTIPGLVIDLDGQPADGDRIRLSQTDGNAVNMRFLLDDPADIAAAGALRVSAAPTNSGTGQISLAVSAAPASEAADLAELLTGSSSDAVEFLSAGVVGMIPAENRSAELLALPRHASLEMSLAAGATANDLTLVSGADTHVFSAGGLSPAEFSVSLMAGDIESDTGLRLSELGLFASGEDGRFTLTAFEDASLPTASLATSAGTVSGLQVTDASSAASLAVFTREGRQIAGPPLSSAQAQELLTEANGFVAGAVYNTDYLNEPSGYGSLQLDRMTGGGDPSVLLGTDLGIATWTGNAPAAAEPATTFSFDGGVQSVDIDIPIGASAALRAQLLEGKLAANTTAQTSVEMSLPATGALSFTLAGTNLDPVRITADIGASGLSGVAAKINEKTFATGIHAELGPDGERLVLTHKGGADITFADFGFDAASTLGLTRLGPDGQRLGATTNFTSGGADAARVQGTVTLSAATDFGVMEGATLRVSENDAFNGGRIERQIADAGGTAILKFPFEGGLDGAGGSATDPFAGTVAYTLRITDSAGIVQETRFDASLSGASDSAEAAAGMAAALRDKAPSSTIMGAALTDLPPEGTQMRVTLGGQGYAIRMTGSGPEVIGPEPDRLAVSFDASNRLTIATKGGHLDGAALTLPSDAGEAARFGLGVADAPQTVLTGQPPEALPASFDLSVGGSDYSVSVSGAGVSLPAGFPGSASVDGTTGAVSISIDARLGPVRIAAQSGAADAGFTTLGAEGFLADGALTLTSTDGRVLEIDASVSGSATRLSLSDLPDEELLVVMTEPGALRLSGALGPENDRPSQAPLEVRVLDAASKLVGLFDSDTGASIATRSLDPSGSAQLGGFSITLSGELVDGDSFIIAPNGNGTGDPSNVERLADLQRAEPGQDRGGFASMFAEMLSDIGARVSGGNSNLDTTMAIKDSAERAEANRSAVDLDEEAARLMQQQQAYQANAQVLSVARQLFTTLMNAL